MEDVVEYREGKLYWKIKPSPNVEIGDEIGGSLSRGYLRFVYKKRQYQVHRVVYYLHKKKWPKVVDHKDRNRLNNYFENLRDASYSQNSMNSSIRTDGKSKYRGVSISKYGKFVSKIKRTYLGSFDKELDAALAYDKAAKELFGEFANINFPE